MGLEIRCCARFTSSGPTKWCKQTGGFECCPDRSFCPTTANPSPSKQYYFRYKVRFVPQADAKQAANYILDASHPKCNIEYNDVDSLPVASF